MKSTRNDVGRNATKKQNGRTATKTTKKAAHEAAVLDGSADSLDLFFANASRYPLLTADEEVDLAQRIERGDMEAKDKLVNSNLRLVISVARKSQGFGLPLSDLVQEGMLGLIRAVEKFDWRRGYKFSTYGTLWIRQAIQRGLANSGRTVRLPVHIGTRARKIARTERELAAKFGRDPTVEELAEAVELPAVEIELIRSADQTPASLDKPVGDSEETSLGDLVASERPSPEAEALDTARDQGVEEALVKLPDDEEKVVRLRFGLGGERPVALSETGRRLGISGEQVRQLERRALERLSEDDDLRSLGLAA